MFKSYLSKLLILSPYLFLFTGLSLIEDGSKRIVVLVIISVITHLAIYKKLSFKNKLPVLAISLFSFYIAIHYNYYSGSPSLIRAYLSAILLLLFFKMDFLSDKTLVTLILLSAIVLCANSLYYSLILNHFRDSGLMNVIPYATFCSGICVLSFYYFINNVKSKIGIISLISLILLLTSVVLTLSRGVWLALFVTFILILIIHAKNLKQLWRYSAIFIISIFVVLFSFKSEFKIRTQQTMAEIKRIEKGDLNSSIGLRLQMWQAAGYIAKEHFWFGIGNDNKPEIEKLYSEGKISKGLKAFHVYHFHNQFIDTQVRFGFIGLLLFLPILIVPIWIAKTTNSPYRTAIFGLTSLYFIASLTDVPFNHNQTVFLYLMLIIPLCYKAQTQNTRKTVKK